MIKEIEVGGERHSITLADDMVGSGLIKAENGSVYLNLDEEGKSLTGCYMTGLAFSGDKLCLIRNVLADGLAGTGIYVESGRLCVSGCRVGSGLFEDYGNFNVNISTESGLSFNANGISSSKPGIGIRIAYRASGLRLFFTNSGALDVTQD